MKGWRFFKYIWKNGDRIFETLYLEFLLEEEFRKRKAAGDE